jgi:hypothetical protein
MTPAARAFSKKLTTSIVLLTALLFPTSAALAGAGSYTLHFQDVTETVRITNPCFGPATGTLTYDGVLHVTENSNGYHVHLNIHGDSFTTPDNPNEPPFSGPFAETQVLNLTRQGEVSTFVVTQVAHGMKFHITFHLALSPGGGQLSVFNFTCGA